MEEPNLGVARALVVILILHVAAIIAIVVHSSSNEDPVIASKASTPEKSSPGRAVLVANQAEKPKISAEDKVEYVQQGDTYERFARRHGVDVQELRRLNNSTPLLYGMPLIVPQPAPALPIHPTHQPALVRQDEIIQESLPPIVNLPSRNTLPQEYEIVEAPQPIEVTPNPYPEPAPLADQPPVEIRRTAMIPEIEPLPVPAIESIPVVEPTPRVVEAPKPTTKSYTIRSGDTFWSISRKHGISVDKLMAANRNIDPKKLRAGKTKIKIPTR